MSRFNLNHHLSVTKPLDNGMMWYEKAEYSDIKEYIKNSILKIRENYIAIGYWLKFVNSQKMYIKDGFSSIEEFAEKTYKISKSTAYRLMEINTEFSKNGNSPELAEEYKDFSKSQLQELLTLPPEQREVVTPEMTVSEIREIKKKSSTDDETIRIFIQELKDLSPENYANEKALKEYLLEEYGKSHATIVHSNLEFQADPKGIVFNHLSTDPDDKMTWTALAKRIIALHTDEENEQIPGQDNILNHPEYLPDEMIEQKKTEKSSPQKQTSQESQDPRAAITEDTELPEAYKSDEDAVIECDSFLSEEQDEKAESIDSLAATQEPEMEKSDPSDAQTAAELADKIRRQMDLARKMMERTDRDGWKNVKMRLQKILDNTEWLIEALDKEERDVFIGQQYSG